MSATIPTIEIAADTTSPIRALHSLCETQATTIVTGLGSLAGTWDIERHESCDGHLSIVINHTICYTAVIIGRDSAGIHVSLMLGDELRTSSYRYASTDAALNAVKAIAGANAQGNQRYINGKVG